MTILSPGMFCGPALCQKRDNTPHNSCCSVNWVTTTRQVSRTSKLHLIQPRYQHYQIFQKYWRPLLTQGATSHPDSYFCNSPIRNRHPASSTKPKSRTKSQTFSCERPLKSCYNNDISFLIIGRLMMTVFGIRPLIISKGLERVIIRCNEKSLLPKHLMYIQQDRLCIQVDRQ